MNEPRELLLGSFHAAVAAADPLRIVPQHLPQPPHGCTLVVGAGKAAASMALAVEQHWPVDAPLAGTVITRYAHGLLTNRITVVEAGHPVPDDAGEAKHADGGHHLAPPPRKEFSTASSGSPRTICCSCWFRAAVRAC